MKVLFVEDSEALIQDVKSFLEAHGFEVSTATSGEEAKKIFLKELPDIVVTDIMLEGKISGYELCKWFKNMKKDIPVIIATSRPPKISRLTAMAAGADDFIPKPYKPEQLLEKIKKFI